jgi:hypothetical protein
LKGKQLLWEKHPCGMLGTPHVHDFSEETGGFVRGFDPKKPVYKLRILSFNSFDLA